MKNIFLLILLIPSICFADVWVEIKLPKTPYKNHDGKVITPDRIIIYNKDKTKITYGGDYIAPKLNNVLERHQSRDTLLVRLKDISDLGIVTKYKILEEKDVEVKLNSLGVVYPQGGYPTGGEKVFLHPAPSSPQGYRRGVDSDSIHCHIPNHTEFQCSLPSAWAYR